MILLFYIGFLQHGGGGYKKTEGGAYLMRKNFMRGGYSAVQGLFISIKASYDARSYGRQLV